MKKSLMNQLILKQHLFLLRMHEATPIKSHIAEITSIINELDKIDVKIEDEEPAILLLFLYLLQTRALDKLSSMKANQLSRSVRSRSIQSTKTKLNGSLYVSLITIIPGKHTLLKRRLIMEVPRVTQNTRIWCATDVTGRGTIRVDCLTLRKKQ